MRALFIIITLVIGQVVLAQEKQAADSINQLLFTSVKAGDYALSKQLILEHNANVNYIDTTIIHHGGSSGSNFKVPNKSFFGALVGVLVLPFVALGEALGSMLSTRGTSYEITTVLEQSIKGPKTDEQKELIELLLKNGASANQNGYEFLYPLHVAVANGDQEIVEILLAYDASIAQASAQRSLCKQAVSKGKTDLAIFLLEKGDDPLLVQNGYNSLNEAIRLGDMMYVLHCGENKVSFERQKGAKFAPYVSALEKGEPRMLNLVKEYYTPNRADLVLENGDNVFHVLYWTNTKGILQELDTIVTQFPNLINAKNSDGETPLNLAVQENNWTYVAWLLKNEALFNAADKSAILKNPHRDIKMYVLETKEDSVQLFQSDYQIALKTGDDDLLMEAMKNGAQPSLEDLTLMYTENNLIVVQAMFDADVLTINEYSSTNPLPQEHYYFYEEDGEAMLHFMLQNGVDPNDGFIVENAARYKTFKYLRILQEYGLDKNVFETYRSKYYHVKDSLAYEYFDALEKWPAWKPVKSDKGFQFVDATGTAVISETYSDARSFQLDRAIVQSNNQYFVIDRKGRPISATYDTIYDYQYKYKAHESALALAVKDEKYFYIDKNGQEVFPTGFEMAFPFDNTYSEKVRMLAAIKLNDSWGVVTDNATVAVLPKYQAIKYDALFYNSKNVSATSKKGKQVYPKIKDIDSSKLLKFND